MNQITPVYGDKVESIELGPDAPELEDNPPILVPEHIPCPEGWRFASRKVTADPLLYEDSAIKREVSLLQNNSVYHSDAAAAHQVCELAYAQLTDWANALKDEGEKNGELDIIAKLSMQSGVQPQWHMYEYDHSQIRVSSEFIKICHAVANHWMRMYRKSDAPSLQWTEEQMMRSDIDKVDSVAGYPSFSPDPLIRLATFKSMALHGLPTVDDLDKQSILWNKDLDIPDYKYPFALGRRFGPTRKPTIRYDLQEGYAYPSRKDVGIWPRVRKIYFSSAVLNKAQSAGYIQLRDAKYSVLGNYHDTASKSIYNKQLSELINKGWVLGESDFSGYDSTISLDMANHMISALIKAGFNERSLRVTQWIWSNAVTFTPSWCSYGEVPDGREIAVYNGDPGLLSGTKDTNNLGSFGANVLAIKGLIQQGFMTMKQAESGDWPLFLDSSDDLLFCTPKPLDPDLYAASCMEEGIKVKYFVGRRFLQKHFYPPNEFAVCARVIQQTLFNEHKILNVGHAALALAARLSTGLTPDGDEFITNHLPSYITGPFSAVMGRITGPASQWSKQLLQQPEVTHFLESAEGQHWLIDQWLEKDFNPSSQGIIDMLGLSAITDETKANSKVFHDLLIDAYLQRSTPDEIKKANKLLYYTIHNTGDHAGSSSILDQFN